MTRTWMCDGVHWLRDEVMLPRAVSKARISVYGYPSQWSGPNAVDLKLTQVARELLVAIRDDRRELAVSLAKREAGEFRGAIDCITACVFLGTPFRGSEAQSWAKMIGVMGSVVGQANYTTLLRTLKSGSTELDDLRHEFLIDVGSAGIDVECYFELQMTKNMIIASQGSSILDGKPQHPWDRNHSQMNKFEGPKDAYYPTALWALEGYGGPIDQDYEAPKQKILNDDRTYKVIDSLEVFKPKHALDNIRTVSGLEKHETPSSWIQSSEMYIAWRDEASSETMWICGGAGKGKTMAAIAIVEELTRRAYEGSDASASVLGYFFCDEQNKDRYQALSVVKSLAGQLIKARKDQAVHFFGDDAVSKTAGYKDSAEYKFDSLPDLWKSLRLALSDPSLGLVLFIVNNLDQIEMESRKLLLSAITSFRPPLPDDGEEVNGPFVKWLFLCAPRDEIAGSLHEARVLNLDDGSNSAGQEDDMRGYVSQKISQIAEKRKYARALEYFVRSFICLRAKGKSNYDWVNLVCLELDNDELDQRAVRGRLEGLPTDLYPMYDQVSRRVLQDSGVQVENVKEISGACFLSDTGPRVQLSHTSVREFLKSKASDWLYMGSEKIQHGVIALRCFDYVLATVEEGEIAEAKQTNNQVSGAMARDSSPEQEVKDEEGSDSDEDDEDDSSSETEYELSGGGSPLRYPVTEWIEHALRATADIVDNLGVADVFWLLEFKDRAEWYRKYTEFTTSTETRYADLPDFDGSSTALHVAAFFGYVPLANLLLKSDQHDGELKASDERGMQPLYWACRKGHLDMHILEKSLYEAVNYQHEDTVRVLLDMGLNANAEGKEYGNALQASAYDGTTNILQMLLDKEAHSSRVYPDSEYSTVLQAACYEGTLENVKVLLDHDAEINPDVSGKYGTPLAAACAHDNIDIVKMLLEHGADPNIEGGQYGYAIVGATIAIDEETLELLLSYGANVNVREPDGSTPLTNAALILPTACVKLLVENGAALDAQDNENDTALTNAAGAGDEETVRYLLEQGADVQQIANRGDALYRAIVGAKEGLFARPLLGAVYNDNKECVELLLEHGANVNLTVGKCHTPLQVAAYFDRVELPEVLLKNNADVNLTAGKYHTALLAVVAGFAPNKLDLVRLLLEYGADAAVVGGPYGSVLHSAIYDKNAGNPLHLAAVISDSDDVSHLLDKGANPNLVAGKYGTPLQAACLEDDYEEMDVLLEHNADP
ncbi:ankyrin repeat-containing domain protein [Aspergillus venezuelensis]